MKFTNAEYRFLSQANHRRGWLPVPLGCPTTIMERILEFRAKALGPEFVSFQEEQRRMATPNAPFIPLEQEIAASKLF